MKRKTRFRSKRNGFTMIEMAIVLIIIGILAAVAIPRLSTSGISAHLAVMKSDITNAITAVTNYYTETGEYPDITVDGRNGATKKKINGSKSNVEIAVSEGNRIGVMPLQCDDGSEGFIIGVDSVYTDKEMFMYNSCSYANIRIASKNNDDVQSLGFME